MISKFIEAIRLPYREDQLFGIVLITLFIGPLFFLPLIGDAFDLPRLSLFSILIGLCIIAVVKRQVWDLRLNPALSNVLKFFIGLNLLALIFSDTVFNSFLGELERRSNSLFFVVLWVVFIVIVALVNTRNKILTLMRVFVASGFLVAILGILHSFGIGYYTGYDPGPRPITPGFIGNQNFSAMFVVGILPFLLPLFTEAKNNVHRILYSIVGFVMIWSLMVFASRGSIVAILCAGALGVILLFLRKFTWSIRLGVVLAFLVTIGMAGVFYTITRPITTSSSLELSTDETTQSRLEVWVQSAELIKAHPWLGVGQGNFSTAFDQVKEKTLVGVERFNDPHNLFISIAVTTGVPALIAFIAIMAIALWVSFKNFWINKSLISWAIGIGLIATLISCMFNPVSISTWIALAFLVAASQYSVVPQALEKINTGKKIIVIIVGVVLVLIGIALLSSEFVSKSGIESYRLAKYEDSIKYGKLALILNPFNSYPRTYIAASSIKLRVDPVIVREQIAAIIKHNQESAAHLQSASALSFMLNEYSKEPQDLQKMSQYLGEQQRARVSYAPILINAAYYEFRAKNYDVAAIYLNQAISVDTYERYPYAHLLLAEVRLQQGRGDLMIKSLQHANAISPNPGYQIIFDDYKNGKFTAKSLPIQYPSIDI